MKKILSLVLVTLFTANTLAATVTVLNAPKIHAKRAFITQDIENLIPIYKSENGWTKVGNKLTGDIGWIPSSQMKSLASHESKKRSTLKHPLKIKKPHHQKPKQVSSLDTATHNTKETHASLNNLPLHHKTFHLKHPHSMTLHYSGTEDINQQDAENLLKQMEQEHKAFTKRILEMEQEMEQFSNRMMHFQPLMTKSSHKQHHHCSHQCLESCSQAQD